MRVQPGKRPTELAKRRAEAGLRQQDIADRVGISQGRYSGIENGHTEPPVTLAREIARVLDVAIDVLWPPKKAPSRRARRRRVAASPLSAGEAA